jgi:hypothetical protein
MAPAYVDSDSESGDESRLATAVYDENEGSGTVAERLANNLEVLDQQVGNWTLERQPLCTQEGVNVQLIRKPTASGLGHHLLPPGVYRYMEPMGTLHDFARLVEAQVTGKNTLREY